MNWPPKTDTRVTDKRVGNLVGSFVLSYLTGVLMLGFLVYFAGIWNILANTRLLGLFIRGGIIKYHDNHAGFVGVPELKYYVMTQDPIDWRLVLIAAGIFFLFWGLRALQFHGIARFYGVEGTFGQHARAYLYGDGVNRILPFGVGDVATAKVLAEQGASLDRAARAVFLAKFFLILEIVVFATIGLYAVGWSLWLRQIFWALMILVVLYLFMRPGQGRVGPEVGYSPFRSARQAFTAVTQEPLLLLKLCLFSFLAFLLEYIAAYVMVMAFTFTNVLLNVDFSILLMGVLGSYVARLILFTPGGIGQFEWGFAVAIYIATDSLPDAATIAILVNVIRYSTGSLVWGAVVLLYGVETNLRSVLAIFTRTELQSART